MYVLLLLDALSESQILHYTPCYEEGEITEKWLTVFTRFLIPFYFLLIGQIVVMKDPRSFMNHVNKFRKETHGSWGKAIFLWPEVDLYLFSCLYTICFADRRRFVFFNYKVVLPNNGNRTHMVGWAHLDLLIESTGDDLNGFCDCSFDMVTYTFFKVWKL